MGMHVLINGLQMELARVVKGTHTETINEKNGLINKALAVLEAHAAVEDKNNANESLTHQGKQQTNRTYATNETVPALKWMKNVIKDKQDKNQGYRKRFFTITSGIDDPAQRVYMWGKLDTLDPNARIKQFVQAAERDDVRVMSAMLENPFGPMVNEEVKERALTERAKRLFPQPYDQYEQNQILLEFLLMMRDWIARVLALEVGVDIAVLRANLGEDIAETLKHQAVGA